MRSLVLLTILGSSAIAFADPTVTVSPKTVHPGEAVACDDVAQRRQGGRGNGKGRLAHGRCRPAARAAAVAPGADRRGAVPVIAEYR